MAPSWPHRTGLIAALAIAFAACTSPSSAGPDGGYAGPVVVYPPDAGTCTSPIAADMAAYALYTPSETNCGVWVVPMVVTNGVATYPEQYYQQGIQCALDALDAGHPFIVQLSYGGESQWNHISLLTPGLQAMEISAVIYDSDAGSLVTERACTGFQVAPIQKPSESPLVCLNATDAGTYCSCALNADGGYTCTP